MEIKPSFSNILCCYLLAWFIFFPHGIISRKLLEIQEESNGQSKAPVRRSHSSTAPSWAGQNSPPVSQDRPITKIASGKAQKSNCKYVYACRGVVP
ncbi:hypothetical protein V6N13_026121 [Hibiscus sabdariffa]|uniref:Uncharacterized protein n=2 Tax=Hibiscus sabdariffa TaxID=183260 RepID=A0ABR1ZZN2_9ROSI